MSVFKKAPAGVLQTVLFGGIGLALTGLCLAGMAQLMALQGYSGAAAAPLATAAVCIGSLCSAVAAAFCMRERGLIHGLLQGVFLAVALAALALLSGTEMGTLQLVRMAAAVLCGGVGGVVGMAGRERRHPMR